MKSGLKNFFPALRGICAPTYNLLPTPLQSTNMQREQEAGMSTYLVIAWNPSSRCGVEEAKRSVHGYTATPR